MSVVESGLKVDLRYKCPVIPSLYAAIFVPLLPPLSLGSELSTNISTPRVLNTEVARTTRLQISVMSRPEAI
jgi:hypothetical protein